MCLKDLSYHVCGKCKFSFSYNSFFYRNCVVTLKEKGFENGCKQRKINMWRLQKDNNVNFVLH